MASPNSAPTTPVAKSIYATLLSELSPQHLELINDSSKHAAGINNPNAETHFTLVVVTDKFSNEPQVARHRLIYKLLEKHIAQGVHALSLQLHTASEWQDKNNAIISSPECAKL